MKHVCTLALLALLAAGTADARRSLLNETKAAEPIKGTWTAVLTQENETMITAVELVEETTAASADDCKKKCSDAGVGCLAYTWCPTGDGCQITTPKTFGSAESMVTDIDAGACILTGDSSNDTFTVLMVKGPGTPFTSGTRVWDPEWIREAAEISIDTGAVLLGGDGARCGSGILSSYTLNQLPPQAEDYISDAAASYALWNNGVACKAVPNSIITSCAEQYHPPSMYVTFKANCDGQEIVLEAWGQNKGGSGASFPGSPPGSWSYIGTPGSDLKLPDGLGEGLGALANFLPF